MLSYILRRLVQAVPVLIGISLIIFILIYYLPADPARIYAGPSATAETVARIRKELGLDDPVWVQYSRYLARMVQGDLGFSYRKQMAVSALILDRLPYTAALVLASILVELMIGLPVGVASALARGRWLDRMGMVGALMGVSVPSFWLGLMLLYWFGYLIPIFPLGGAGSSPWSAHLFLPAVTAGLGGAAWYARMMRSSTLEVLSQDFVRTAHAKGLHRGHVLTRHVLTNSLNPIITMAGMDIPWFIGGVVLVERIFNWPGVGRLAVEAIETVDVPLILGTVIFTACVVVLSGILIDLVQGLFDPRIRYEKS